MNQNQNHVLIYEIQQTNWGKVLAKFQFSQLPLLLDCFFCFLLKWKYKINFNWNCKIFRGLHWFRCHTHRFNIYVSPCTYFLLCFSDHGDQFKHQNDWFAILPYTYSAVVLSHYLKIDSRPSRPIWRTKGIL